MKKGQYENITQNIRHKTCFTNLADRDENKKEHGNSKLPITNHF
jgi:hypothetical protein